MSMPRVLIDVERLRQLNSGLGQVALHLGRQFLRNPSDRWRPVFLIPDDRLNVFGQPIDFETPSWRRRHAPRFAPSYDLWHVLHQGASYLPSAKTPYVLTIHDLNILEEKSAGKAHKRLRKVQKLLDGAAAATVISVYTKTLVEEHLTLGGAPLEVIYNGMCTDSSGEGTRPDRLPDGEFLFAVGAVRKKKNFHVLVDFLSLLDGMRLVIAGNTARGYAQEIVELARRRGIEDRVIIAGEVADREKVWLFRNCEAFVFPSLLEGFGLPLVEAMSFGKPIFCAARGSLPEIGGDDVFYWDSFDAQYMIDIYQRGMSAFTSDPDRAARLRIRADTFSWEAAARRYSQIYERVLSARA